MAKQLPSFSTPDAIAMAIGTLVVLAVATLKPGSPPEGLWFVFVSGAIAICAMILPGISGSFLLLLMGMYQLIISAIKDLQLTVLLVFMSGTAVGLLGFSHILVCF